MSLFDVENVEEMPKVRDMIVGPVGARDVREFAKRYHYTGSADSIAWRWGLWDGAVLHGVVAYNMLTANVCRSVFGSEYASHVWHMSRLILSEESPRNSESRLIGGSLKLIQREYPDVWAILTYAAQHVNHIGYVYQATNAIYTGLAAGGECVYLDTDGLQRSRRGLDIDKYDGASLAERAEARGWTRVNVPKKHRYVYILGSKTQRRQRRALLRYPVLPYPKAVVA
jgi:hypothetical protein